MDELETQIYFGESAGNGRGRGSGWPCAYMLLYESQELLDEFHVPGMNQPAAK